MRKQPLQTLGILVVLALLAVPVSGAPLEVGEGDGIGSVLAAQQGKRVTVRLAAGGEMTGTVARVNADVVHLRELAGMEYFDAVVALPEVAAVVVRAKP